MQGQSFAARVGRAFVLVFAVIGATSAVFTAAEAMQQITGNIPPFTNRITGVRAYVNLSIAMKETVLSVRGANSQVESTGDTARAQASEDLDTTLYASAAVVDSAIHVMRFKDVEDLIQKRFEPTVCGGSGGPLYAPTGVPMLLNPKQLYTSAIPEASLQRLYRAWRSAITTAENAEAAEDVMWNAAGGFDVVRLYFTCNATSKNGPGALMVATSTDGAATWTVGALANASSLPSLRLLGGAQPVIDPSSVASATSLADVRWLLPVSTASCPLTLLALTNTGLAVDPALSLNVCFGASTTTAAADAVIAPSLFTFENGVTDPISGGSATGTAATTPMLGLLFQDGPSGTFRLWRCLRDCAGGSAGTHWADATTGRGTANQPLSLAQYTAYNPAGITISSNNGGGAAETDPVYGAMPLLLAAFADNNYTRVSSSASNGNVQLIGFVAATHAMDLLYDYSSINGKDASTAPIGTPLGASDAHTRVLAAYGNLSAEVNGKQASVADIIGMSIVPLGLRTIAAGQPPSWVWQCAALPLESVYHLPFVFTINIQAVPKNNQNADDNGNPALAAGITFSIIGSVSISLACIFVMGKMKAMRSKRHEAQPLAAGAHTNTLAGTATGFEQVIVTATGHHASPPSSASPDGESAASESRRAPVTANSDGVINNRTSKKTH